MEVKENRPDACAASGTANSIYKDFSTDAPDIQEELTGPVLPDECAADIVSFCSEQTIAYDDLLEYLHLRTAARLRQGSFLCSMSSQ